jgi:hypothetical protein
MNTALALTSFRHIDDRLTIDDYTFRELGRLAAERQGQAEAVWEQGLATGLPRLPVIDEQRHGARILPLANRTEVEGVAHEIIAPRLFV